MSPRTPKYPGSVVLVGVATPARRRARPPRRHRRNRHVGYELSRGRQLEEFLAAMIQVAEGVHAAAVVMKLAAERGTAMPITHEVDAVINHGHLVEESYRGLLRVRPGHEVYGEAW